jgi:hypothetical protein
VIDESARTIRRDGSRIPVGEHLSAIERGRGDAYVRQHVLHGQSDGWRHPTSFRDAEGANADGVQTGSKVPSEIASEEAFDEPPGTVAEQLSARLVGDEAELFLAYRRQLVRTSATA